MTGGPTYPLDQVRKKIAAGEVNINEDVLRDAYMDFGWGVTEVLEALKQLKPKHFVKSDISRINPLWMLDSYRAKSLYQGEDVYTHFYIHHRSKKLIINSFKAL